MQITDMVGKIAVRIRPLGDNKAFMESPIFINGANNTHILFTHLTGDKQGQQGLLGPDWLADDGWGEIPQMQQKCPDQLYGKVTIPMRPATKPLTLPPLPPRPVVEKHAVPAQKPKGIPVRIPGFGTVLLVTSKPEQ